jgi:hypothetical protein
MLFSQDRYLFISCVLYFCNKDEQGNSKSHEGKLEKMFSALQELCIDETLVRWKGG